MSELWHYTCAHMAIKIGSPGVLIPRAQPFLGGRRLVWLTDLDVADREALGLTSNLVDCDRTEVRYRVVHPERLGAPTWREWAEAMHVSRAERSALELGRRAARWWVSTVPVKVRRS